MWRSNVPLARNINNANHVIFPRPQVTLPQRRGSSLLPPGGVPFPFLRVLFHGAGGAGEIDVDVIMRSAIVMTISSSHLKVIALTIFIGGAVIHHTLRSPATSIGGLRVIFAAASTAVRVSRPPVPLVNLPLIGVVSVTSSAGISIPITTRVTK